MPDGHGSSQRVSGGLVVDRRELLKATGVGLFGLGSVSGIDRAAGQQSASGDAHEGLGVTLVPSDDEVGFHYPYYLYAPPTDSSHERPLLIEPNNTGSSTDDFGFHHKNTRPLIADGNQPVRGISDTLELPLLVPVFPRPESDPVDWRHYTHYLDTDTMAISSGELARIDEQLLRMAEHARSHLRALSYPVNDEIALNGYSASGNFVNRFAALHPEVVTTVTAGGINGTPILPIASDKGHTLNYQIGIADLESLTGEPFDRDAFTDVDQYLYMGGDDTNDTVPFDDAWSADQRAVALAVYGDDMQDDRMPYSESVYEEVGASATFEIYPGVGHEYTDQIRRDIVAFHRSNMDVSRVGFAAPPAAGDATVSVSAAVAPDRTEDSLEVDVFDEGNARLTTAAATIRPGEAREPGLDLARPLRSGETVTAAVLAPGASDPDGAIVAQSTTVIDTASVRFISAPMGGDERVTVEYALADDYAVEQSTNVRIQLAEHEYDHLTAIEPGDASLGRFRLSAGKDGVPLSAGGTAALQVVDAGEVLASKAARVRESAPTGERASIEFSREPTHGDTTVALRYSIDDGYEPVRSVRVQLYVDGNGVRQTPFLSGTYPMLLSQIEPGESGTTTFAADHVPLEAADALEAVVADARPLARAETTVGVDGSGGGSSGDSGSYPAVGGGDHVVDIDELRTYLSHWASREPYTEDDAP